MANYKNKKPKTYRGCCGMCCLRKTDGRRNHRRLTPQEQKFELSAEEEEQEERLLKEDREIEQMLDDHGVKYGANEND